MSICAACRHPVIPRMTYIPHYQRPPCRTPVPLIRYCTQKTVATQKLALEVFKLPNHPHWKPVDEHVRHIRDLESINPDSFKIRRRDTLKIWSQEIPVEILLSEHNRGWVLHEDLTNKVNSL